MRLLTGVLGGLFLACMGTAIVMAIAPPRYQSVGPLIFFAFLTIGCAIAFATRTVARAWRTRMSGAPQHACATYAGHWRRACRCASST